MSGLSFLTKPLMILLNQESQFPLGTWEQVVTPV